MTIMPVLPLTLFFITQSYSLFICNNLISQLQCSGLVMIQTSLIVYSPIIYNLSTSQALLAWHRVRLANWLATNGEEWAAIVSPYNSGIVYK